MSFSSSTFLLSSDSEPDSVGVLGGDMGGTGGDMGDLGGTRGEVGVTSRQFLSNFADFFSLFLTARVHRTRRFCIWEVCGCLAGYLSM